jgi:hypothetical protein
VTRSFDRDENVTSELDHFKAAIGQKFPMVRLLVIASSIGKPIPTRASRCTSSRRKSGRF